MYQLKQTKSIVSQSCNGREVYNWIIKNLPPLTWNILAVKAGDQFINHGIDPYNISENTTFKPELVTEINFFVKSYYNKELPMR